MPAPAAVTLAPPVGDILAAYERATGHAADRSLQISGTLTGEGLSGEFHSWAAADNERDDQRLGPRSEVTLRLGQHYFLRSASGNVRELTGYLRRRARTADFIDSGDFVKEPQRSRFLGFDTLGGVKAWRLEVCADGGEPETLWIDTLTGLPLRVQYLDGDGPTTIDFSDWRTVGNRRFPFKSLTSDGDRAFDVVAVTTSIQLNASVDPGIFAPLANRTIVAAAVQTVPLIERGGHIACAVTIGAKPYEFLLDTGAQSVLLDSRVATAQRLPQAGELEVRGVNRTGGLHVLNVPRIDIGSAHLDDLVATSIDLSTVTSGRDRLDGILGFPFFASSLVELDFAHHTMRFGVPGSFAPQGTRLALDLDRGLVETTLRIAHRIAAPFVIDTGNNGEVLLYRPFIVDHPGVVPVSDRLFANYGIGGSTRTYRSSLDEVDIGDTALYHQVADVVSTERGAFADHVDAGNIGLGVLRNFVVTFDLTNGALYVRKSDDFDDGRLRAVTSAS